MKEFFLLFSFILLMSCGIKREPSYLFIDPETLPDLREMVRREGTHHAEAFNALKWRVDQHDLAVYGEGINRYNRSFFAQEAAFVSLISEKDEVRRQYAQIAFDGVKDIYDAPEQERLPHEDYGLSRAMMQLGLAMPYAWCRAYWTDQQKEYVQHKITEALDAWLTYDHANFWHTKGSNWVAVCRGGELVLLLAAGLQEERRDRCDFLIGQLKVHIQNGYGSLGVSQEGIGYTEYGGQFLLKAVFASASMGDSTLYREAQSRAWWTQAMYIESFQPQDLKFLMTGVAGSGGFNEGWASLLLNLTPEDDLSYFCWWYDRHMGIQSPADPKNKYDNQRAGTIWSVLYYPLKDISMDPTGVYPAGVADDRGYYFFRNRWVDKNDILFSIMADGYHHSHAWDQPEVFALNLMAYDTRFIGGPSKERDDKLYSTLLVDGKYNIKRSATLTAHTLDWETGPSKGFVSIDGGPLYDSLGVESANRQMAIQFLDENRAIICLMDLVKSKKAHAFTWQLNLGDQRIQEEIRITRTQNQFSLISDQGRVDGWVFSPASFSVEDSNDPFRITFTAKETSFLVIMYLHSSGGPAPTLVEVAPNKQYQLLGYTINYDDLYDRIRLE